MGSSSQKKSKPLLMQVDELFSQYFPEVKEEEKSDYSENSVAHKKSHVQETKAMAVQIVHGILAQVVKTAGIPKEDYAEDERQKNSLQSEKQKYNNQNISITGEISINSAVKDKNLTNPTSEYF